MAMLTSGHRGGAQLTFGIAALIALGSTIAAVAAVPSAQLIIGLLAVASVCAPVIAARTWPHVALIAFVMFLIMVMLTIYAAPPLWILVSVTVANAVFVVIFSRQSNAERSPRSGLATQRQD